MTADDVIDRAARLISDPKNKRFTKPILLIELNKILSEASSAGEFFKKSSDIQIQDLKRTYEFPEDMLQLKQMTIEHITGELIFSTTFETLVVSGISFHRPSAEATAFKAFGFNARDLTNRLRIFFRDLVSDHEFQLDPVLEATNITPDEDPSVIEFGS